MECIFCQIIVGTMPSAKIYEDERLYVFHNLYPEAPVHILVIPKKHISSLLTFEVEDAELLGHMFHIGNSIATEQLGLEGYKAVINTGEQGGQEVFHLHVHIMGGAPLSMPKTV